MLRYFIAGLLAMQFFGLCAHDEYFQSIIENAPKNATARYSYDTYVINEYGNKICLSSYPCNSQLSGYLAKGEIYKFLAEGKLGFDGQWFEAVLDTINLRKLQFNPNIFWRELLSEFNLWRKIQDQYNERKAKKDKKFAKKWQKKRQQRLEEWNIAKNQWQSQYIDRKLKALKKELIKRIKRIEYQLEKKHRFDSTYLTYSAASLVVATILFYISYCKYHRVPWSTLAGMSLFLTGITFALSCNPNYDNEYLPKYKKLLRFIIYLEKHGYNGWRMEVGKNKKGKT